MEHFYKTIEKMVLKKRKKLLEKLHRENIECTFKVKRIRKTKTFFEYEETSPK